ncbi:MAG: hypothetical protein ACOYOH_06510 [Paracraurococcus sp.]
MRLMLALMLACAIAASCAPNSGNVAVAEASKSPGSGVGTAVPGFRCPPAGTRVGYSNGNTFEATGVDPADPSTCRYRVTRPQGTTDELRYLGYWSAPPAPEVRNGFAKLFPMAIGKEAHFVRQDLDYARMAQQLDEAWRLVDRAPLEIAAKPRDAWIIERRISSPGFEENARVWIDVETFVPLRLVRTSIQGGVRGWAPPYAAISFELPQ